jgi:hypothetical protein
VPLNAELFAQDITDELSGIIDHYSIDLVFYKAI